MDVLLFVTAPGSNNAHDSSRNGTPSTVIKNNLRDNIC